MLSVWEACVIYAFEAVGDAYALLGDPDAARRIYDRLIPLLRARDGEVPARFL